MVVRAAPDPGAPALLAALAALDQVDLFNLLVLAADAGDGSVERSAVAAADQLCLAHRAVQLLDAPAAWSVDDVVAAVGDFMPTLGVHASAKAALNYPRLRQPDPLRDGEWRVVPASGAVAGLIAASDLAHGPGLIFPTDRSWLTSWLWDDD